MLTVRPPQTRTGPPRSAADAGEAIDAPVSPGFVHRIRFTEGAFDPGNRVLGDVVDAPDGPARCLLVVDEGVIAADPRGDALARMVDGLADPSRRLELRRDPIVVPGGEAAKADRSVVDAVVAAVHRHGICRRSYVLVVGGGAVLDAVGFAAATAHRGVRLIRFPSTTLAQDDAGIGVKNGINAFGVKNFVGAFAVPWAVINDLGLLRTQSLRDRRSGVSEAIKVALLKDSSAFAEIEALAPRLAAGEIDALAPVVRRSAELHLDHIVAGGDPFEADIARPLDFGHWSAHRLEELTAFDVRHGEAVAIGLAIDVTYAASIGRLSAADAARIIDVLEACGLPTRHPDLANADAVLEGLEAFREHLGGRLTITLVSAPGAPLDVHEIDDDVMRAAILSRASDAGDARNARDAREGPGS